MNCHRASRSVGSARRRRRYSAPLRRRAGGRRAAARRSGRRGRRLRCAQHHTGDAGHPRTAEVGHEHHTNNLFLDCICLSTVLDWDWKATARCRARRCLAIRKPILRAGPDRRPRANDHRPVGGRRLRARAGVRPALPVEHREGSNSSFTRRASKSNTEAIEGGVSYNRAGLLGAALNYRDERFTYPNRMRPEDGSVTEVLRRAVCGEVGGTVAERICCTVTVDCNWVDPRGAGEGFDGLDVTIWPAPRYRVQLQAVRSIEPAVRVRGLCSSGPAGTRHRLYDQSADVAQSARRCAVQRYGDLQPVNLAHVRPFHSCRG